MTDIPKSVTAESTQAVSPSQLYNLEGGQSFYSWEEADIQSTLFMQNLFAERHSDKQNPIKPIKQPKELSELQIAQLQLISRLQNMLGPETTINVVPELNPDTKEPTGNSGFIVTKKPPQTTA